MLSFVYTSGQEDGSRVLASVIDLEEFISFKIFLFMTLAMPVSFLEVLQAFRISLWSDSRMLISGVHANILIIPDHSRLIFTDSDSTFYMRMKEFIF